MRPAGGRRAGSRDRQGTSPEDDTINEEEGLPLLIHASGWRVRFRAPEVPESRLATPRVGLEACTFGAGSGRKQTHHYSRSEEA